MIPEYDALCDLERQWYCVSVPLQVYQQEIDTLFRDAMLQDVKKHGFDSVSSFDIIQIVMVLWHRSK